MSKFTFICQEESMPFMNSTEAKRTVEFRADGLSDILQEFEAFLRGAGFYFEGQLDIVNDEELVEEQEYNTAWNGIVNSLMNPPSFRAVDLTGKNS